MDSTEKNTWNIVNDERANDAKANKNTNPIVPKGNVRQMCVQAVEW